MSIIIEDIRHGTEFYAGTTPHIQGNKNWKITTEIDFRVENWIDVTPSNRVSFGVDGYLTNDYLQSVDSSLFTDFQVGMTFQVVNADNALNDGTYTVIEKIDNSTIRINTVVGFQHIDGGADIIVTDTINGIKFLFGIIFKVADNFFYLLF